jgi:hypothetical protein
VRAKTCWAIAGFVVLATSVAAQAQDASSIPAKPKAKTAAASPASPAAPASDLATGPATVAPHWSKYEYPRSVPEGALYHMIVRGDTLWDLSRKYLNNPYLWPQLWHENGYIKDAHWIYPGDPLVLPRLQVVAGQAGAAGETLPGGGLPGEAGELLPPEEAAAGVSVGGARGQRLAPLAEQTAAQCAPYIPDHPDDQSLKILGPEAGPVVQVMMATGEVFHINRGSDDGMKPGDVFSIHRVRQSYRSYEEHGNRPPKKVITLGWARVILTEAHASSAVIEQACQDIQAGDYLLPFKAVPVPMIPRLAASSRLTPHTDKAAGRVIDLEDLNDIAGAGNFAIIDIGSDEGVSPGTILQVFRVEYPSVPSPRHVIGDLAVLLVQERTATAKIIHSDAAIMPGDQVEVR